MLGHVKANKVVFVHVTQVSICWARPGHVSSG